MEGSLVGTKLPWLGTKALQESPPPGFSTTGLAREPPGGACPCGQLGAAIRGASQIPPPSAPWGRASSWAPVAKSILGSPLSESPPRRWELDAIGSPEGQSGRGSQRWRGENARRRKMESHAPSGPRDPSMRETGSQRCRHPTIPTGIPAPAIPGIPPPYMLPIIRVLPAAPSLGSCFQSLPGSTLPCPSPPRALTAFSHPTASLLLWLPSLQTRIHAAVSALASFLPASSYRGPQLHLSVPRRLWLCTSPGCPFEIGCVVVALPQS